MQVHDDRGEGDDHSPEPAVRDLKDTIRRETENLRNVEKELSERLRKKAEDEKRAKSEAEVRSPFYTFVPYLHHFQRLIIFPPFF